MGSKFDISGKVALITGAAGLLGCEHAKALLDRGATVVLTDIREKELLDRRDALASSYGSVNVLALVMDVTSENSVRQTADILKERALSVSILVNNAAIDPKVASESTLEKILLV